MSSSITTSPVLANSERKRSWQSPSLYAQNIVAQQELIPRTASMAPSFARSPTGPSSSTTPANLSLQSSPEGFRGRILPSSNTPTPLQLPESTIAIPASPSPSAMSDAMTLNKGQGLIRRISRGAANRLVRRRQSSNQASDRDRSSGPLVRQRSNSNCGTELDSEPAGLGLSLDKDGENILEDTMALQGSRISGEAIGAENSNVSPPVPRTQGGIAPIVPSILRQGTILTKVTKRKRRNFNFVLDVDSARVSWDPSNASKRFYIDDIQQIRPQREAKNYREEFQVSADLESRWFTIIYADQDRAKGRPVKSMHLIAPNQHVFELWTSTLNDLARYRHELMAGLVGSGQDERTLQGHWNREMAKLFNGAPHAEDQEHLDFAGIESLCRSLHFNCSKNLLRAQFDKANTDDTGFLSFYGFKDFVRRLKERIDIKNIYKSITSENPEGLNLEWFLKFLQNTQGVDVEPNREHWVKVFFKHARKSECNPSILHDERDESLMQMDFAAFSAFLSSTYNNIQNFKAPEVKLDRPLNEYFISSSHNTYLLGRQVAGSSSVEAYIRALQRACRCVEIDCWDGTDGRPIVLHGRTMTSSVLFSDCIAVIGKYAFTESPYPLILSLEVHCNAEQQQAMVDIMKLELGERLLKEPLMTNFSSLPSPEDLRHRILVKVKAGQDLTVRTRTNSPVRRRERAFSSPFSRPQVLDNSSISSGPILSSPPSMSPSEHSSTWLGGRSSTTATSMSSATDDSDTANIPNSRSRKPTKIHKSKIIKSLGDLGVYTQGIKFADFSSAGSKSSNHVFSLSERRFEGLCRDQEMKGNLEEHNMRYLMRVYPSGFRMKSTNPDPLVFWRRGAQMVALNWQTYDLGMQMNGAMFASGSDRFGYVLKPKHLRNAPPPEDPAEEPANCRVGKMPKKLIRFSVDMISAQQLPHPRGTGLGEALDPYIEIEMFSAEDKAKGLASGEGGMDASARNGMSGIGSPHRRRTHVVQSNGYNPIFNDTFRLSLETKYPDLVFVRWTAWNSQDGHNYNNGNTDPLATFTAKLSSLEQGYRHLPLYDHNGDQFLFATLFCQVKKEDPITIMGDDPIAEKVGRLKQFGQTVFKRTLSVEKRNTRDFDKKSPKEKDKSSSKDD